MTILKNRHLWRPGIRSCLALGLISMCSGLPAAWAQDDSPSEVTVPDAALRAVVEDSLGLAAGEPILATELTELEARDAGILDLTLSLSAGQDTVQAQTEPVDSLAVKEMPLRRGGIWRATGDYRLLAKVGAGSWFGGRFLQAWLSWVSDLNIGDSRASMTLPSTLEG